MYNDKDLTQIDNYSHIYRSLERAIDSDEGSLFIDCDSCVNVERTIELAKINSRMHKCKHKSMSAFKKLNGRGRNL